EKIFQMLGKSFFYSNVKRNGASLRTSGTRSVRIGAPCYVWGSDSAFFLYFSTTFPVVAQISTPPHAINENPAGIHAIKINLKCLRLKNKARNAGRNHSAIATILTI